jgi:hypothetical protein
VKVGDLVRYKPNAFMGEVSPADYGVGIVINISLKNYWSEDSVVRVQWHNAKTKWKNVRQTNDCLSKLEVVSENR